MSKRSLFLTLSLCLSWPIQAQILIDPTRPPGYQAPVSTPSPQSHTVEKAIKWRLDTTLVSPYQSVAMINGKRVTIGDDVDGATVMQIDHQSVVLSLKGKTMVLKVNDPFMSQLRPAR